LGIKKGKIRKLSTLTGRELPPAISVGVTTGGNIELHAVIEVHAKAVALGPGRRKGETGRNGKATSPSPKRLNGECRRGKLRAVGEI